jgi:hypothetical protein
MTRKRKSDPTLDAAAPSGPGAASNPGDASPAYEVGYGKPPKDTRFKPGQSGNPRGRPKGRLNASEVLSRELDQKVSVREGGTTVRMSKRDAAIKRLVADAIGGKKYALDVVFAHERALAEASGAAVHHSDEDAAILERFLARLGERQPQG